MKGLIGILVMSLFVLGATLTGSARVANADLKVTASGSFMGGSFVTYSSTTKNKGPDTATGVVVSGGISGGSVTSVSASQGSCTFSGDSFTCNIGTLTSGQTVSVNMSGTTPNFGSHPNDITYCGGHYIADAQQNDPVSSNNTATACVVIPGSSCPNPQGCGTTCQPGFFWCARVGTCLAVGQACPP